MISVAAPRRVWRAGAVLAAGVAAAAGGYALARAATRFEDLAPLVMVLAVALPVAAVAVVADPRIGVLLVFLVFPIGFTPLPGVPLDLVQGTIIGVSALVLVSRIRMAESAPRMSPVYWWVVALLAWTLLGTPSAVDVDLAVRRLPSTAAQLLFGVAIVTICRRRDDLRVVAFGLVAIVAAVGLTTLGGASQVRTDFGGAVVSGRATAMFSEPNQLGSFSAIGALVGAGLALSLRSRGRRLLVGALTVLAVLALLLSLSRGAWLGFGLGMLVLLVQVPRARRALAVTTVALFVVALTYGALRPQSPEVHVVGERFRSFTGEQNPYDDRPTIWAEARREIRVDPLTGHGLGNFPLVARRSTSKSHTSFPPHAHNLLLNWGAETGVPGVALILGFAGHLGVATRRAFRRMRAEGRMHDAALLAGLAGAALAVFGQGLVDYTLWSTVVFTQVWAVLGLLVAAVELERR
ncbi:MAG TPA: O-antigen ligase family protein [Acidimicrobiales bacterium]|nr:O-antigen ligase family protein [Acidimicrobiales bacterium]